MKLVRAMGFNLAFYGLTGVMAVVALPILLGPRSWVCGLRDGWVRVSLGLLAGIVGLRHQVRGLENLPEGPIIVASKHQSAWETLGLHLVFPDPSIVLKRELYRLPLFGMFLAKTGMIGIDRRAGASALKSMIAQAEPKLAAGRPLLIFPEGTRMAPGTSQDYHPGVFALYRALNVPVVPVALNSGMFWGRLSFMKLPGLITVDILPPIEPGLKRREFLTALQERIEPATRALEASAKEIGGRLE